MGGMKQGIVLLQAAVADDTNLASRVVITVLDNTLTTQGLRSAFVTVIRQLGFLLHRVTYDTFPGQQIANDYQLMRVLGQELLGLAISVTGDDHCHHRCWSSRGQRCPASRGR
jgi:hypothetical protein